MSRITRIRQWLAKQIGGSYGYGYVVSSQAAHSWSSRNFAELIDDGYKKNAHGYASIELIAKLVPRMPWQILIETPGGDQEAPDTDDLVKLWKAPSKTWKLDNQEFLRLVTTFLRAGGECPIRKVRSGANDDGRVKQLIPMRPDKLTPVPDKDGKDPYASWEYKTSGSSRPESIRTDNVIFIRYADPLKPERGMSPLEPASKAIDMLNAGDEWNIGALENGGTFSLQFTTPDSMNQDEAEKAEKRINEKLKAGKRVYVGNLRAEQLGSNPSDMSWSSLETSSARALYNVQAVPSTFGPDVQSQNYAQLKGAMRQLLLFAVLPVAKKIASALNMQLCDQDFPGHRFEIIEKDIPELAEELANEWAAITAAWDLTIDEKRERRGYDPMGGDLGNELWVPNNVTLAQDAMADMTNQEDET